MKKQRPMFQLYIHNAYRGLIKPRGMILSLFLITRKYLKIYDKKYRDLFPSEMEYKIHYMDTSKHNKTAYVPDPSKWIVINAGLTHEGSGRIDVYIKPLK